MKNTIIYMLASMFISLPLFAEVSTFVVDDPGGRNVMEFTSDAPIENIVGTTNKVTGWITFDPQNLSENVKANVEVDLTGMSTGIRLRDEHMHSEDYLNTKKFPVARFEFDGNVSTQMKKMTPGEKVPVEFWGELSLHGVTKKVRVTGKASFFNEKPELVEYGYPGDMVNFDGTFMIKLPDFNINVPEMLFMKLSEEIEVKVNFTATTGREK